MDLYSLPLLLLMFGMTPRLTPKRDCHWDDANIVRKKGTSAKRAKACFLLRRDCVRDPPLDPEETGMTPSNEQNTMVFQ